eukprot:3152555-Amphidinium_carterae.1
MKGLKPRPMDENVLRVSRQWNKVHHDPDEEQQWVQSSPYRSMLMPDGSRAWLCIEDGYVQHQQPFWCELPQELT